MKDEKENKQTVAEPEVKRDAAFEAMKEKCPYSGDFRGAFYDGWLCAEKHHPPKPAEPEAETIETLKAENFKLASGQCTEGGPWGDEGGTPYCKYAKLERHNDD